MNDPTILPVSIALAILVAIAYYQRLYRIIGILGITYLVYLGFVFFSARDIPLSNNKMIESKAIKLTEEDSTELTVSPITPDSILIEDSDDENRSVLPETVIERGGEIESPISLRSLFICTAMDFRTPVGIDSIFSNDVEALYCFTGVSNPFGETKQITHFWKYKGTYVAKVNIDIGSSWNWRCWSRVSIQPQWIGNWEVSILDSNGTSFRSILFSIVESDSSSRPTVLP